VEVIGYWAKKKKPWGCSDCSVCKGRWDLHAGWV